MLEPTGPLPPEIYWRRRALAIGVVVAVLALIIVVVVSVTGGSDDSPSNASSSNGLSNPTPTYRPDASATPGSGFDGVGGAGGSGSGSAGSGSGSAGSGAAGSGAAGSNGAPAAPSTTPASAAPAIVPGQCPDQSMAVKAAPAAPNFPAGQEPSFTVVVTNIGTVQCARDLGSGLQQVLVYTLDNQRLWSNIDCFPAGAPDVRTLGAGQQATFTVKWSGTTSAPGCTAPRNPVGPGGYSVVGQLGELRSAPETFNIT